MTNTDHIERAIGKLRADAIERGLSDLAIAYGWSQIRLREELLGRRLADIDRYKLGTGH